MSRTVLITGAAGHLGKAVADHFAGQGARLALLDRQQAVLAATYPEKGDRLLLATDLLDGAQTDAAIAAVVERLGRIDLLCHLVGGFRMGQPVHAASDADWDFLFDINTRTLRNVARAAVPRMIAAGGGKIVTVRAASAQRGLTGMGAYTASKSATIRLTEAMSAELREQRINVNCVLPTIIDTPENRAAMPDADAARWPRSSASSLPTPRAPCMARRCRCPG